MQYIYNRKYHKIDFNVTNLPIYFILDTVYFAEFTGECHRCKRIVIHSQSQKKFCFELVLIIFHF